MATLTDTAIAPAAARRITVRGVVQGVGFRPFVYNLAQRYGVRGWVRNTSGSVEIVAEGDAAVLDAFADAIRRDAPPLACIDTLSVQPAEAAGYSAFAIRASETVAGAYQWISPDVATCDACLRELADPTDRRYRYPFTNCTHCGPRFTIIADIPYDRPNTTMRAFAMCPACQAEYDDPANRRFHAQPNACPDCGPHVWLEAPGRAQPVAERDEAMRLAASWLQQGRILALKGLGGFHLACDATDAGAVARLRERKRRPAKPLAVMFPSPDALRQHCDVDGEAERLLTSPQHPIVLVPWRQDSDIARAVAPDQPYLGALLPYTPLHHLLLADAGRPLVMTSGNLSEEPICQRNDEARARLAGIADAFLLHDRDIYARYDDSVWFVLDDGPQPVRRSRGDAPHPIPLPLAGEPVLACGGELKNTFCLTRDAAAFVSPHIGDLENWETWQHFEASVALYQRLFRATPVLLAHDLHPDYLSTRYALERAQRDGLPTLGIQHHHAHIAACLADNGRTEPVIGLALDGTGYGLDGSIWGGEALIADLRGFRRAAHLDTLPLAGGEAAIHRPDRLAYGYLVALWGDAPDLPAFAHLSGAERAAIRQQVTKRIHAPLTSSAGRWCDAVAALLGLCHEATYEAQAAMRLEAAAGDGRAAATLTPYPFDLYDGDAPLTWGDVGELPDVARTRRLMLGATFAALVDDIRRGEPVAVMARRTHATLAAMCVRAALWLREETGLRTVALSGGCWQNRLLYRLTRERLLDAGFAVLTHHHVPTNDGGLSLGQAAIALATLKDRRA